MENNKDNETQKKMCFSCKEYLSISNFYRDNQKKDGLRSYCIDCHRNKNGITASPPPTFTSCKYCQKQFRINPHRMKKNVGKWGLFCCKEHEMEHKKDKSTTYAKGYQKYIIDRDNACCFLCKSQMCLHVHHIITRGAGGTNEYHNLITLCSNCHLSKAHGANCSMYRELFQSYVSKMARPLFWDDIIEKTERDTKKIKKKRRESAQKTYYKIKNSDQYKEYKQKQKELRKKRDEEYKKIYGCSYMSYRYKIAKGIALPKNNQ